MTMGERVRAAREKKGYTQDELAQKLGYKSRSSVNKIEKERDIPRSMIVKLAAILDVTPAYLMGWDDPETKESPSPVEDEREAYRAILSDLTDEELIEMKKFTSYLRWKRNHPQGESDK